MSYQRVREQETVVQEVAELPFRLIEDLQSLGINVSDIKKLQESGKKDKSC